MVFEVTLLRRRGSQSSALGRTRVARSNELVHARPAGRGRESGTAKWLSCAIGIAFVLVLAGGTQASIGHAAAARGGGAVMLASASPDSGGAFGSPNQSGRDFYVSPSGSDDDLGTSPGTPWQTLAKVYTAPLLPGDRVHLEGGAVFTEPLAPYAGRRERASPPSCSTPTAPGRRHSRRASI